MANRRCTCQEPFLPRSAWTLSDFPTPPAFLPLTPWCYPVPPCQVPLKAAISSPDRQQEGEKAAGPTFAPRVLENS